MTATNSTPTVRNCTMSNNTSDKSWEATIWYTDGNYKQVTAKTFQQLIVAVRARMSPDTLS